VEGKRKLLQKSMGEEIIMVAWTRVTAMETVEKLKMQCGG
jgi:hypothetical protein